MTTLTPTARTLLALLAEGPATTEQLHERCGRSRTTVDRTVTDLAGRDLITHDEASPDDDGGDRWTLTVAGHATFQDGATPDSGDPEPPEEEDGDPHDTDSPDDDVANPGSGGADGDEDLVVATGERVKHCRGCRAEIPPICPTCWQKTTVFCGSCRRTMPTVDRGAPREPQILSNGLPKLRPGELERLILDVLAAHPVPDFGGVLGWTSGRIAVHLPGRSVGAINRVLDKLASTGGLTQLGTDPKRYTPPPTETGDAEAEPTDDLTEGDEPGAEQPPAEDDADVEDQPQPGPHDAVEDGWTHDHTQ
jgi:hypothetical protein